MTARLPRSEAGRAVCDPLVRVTGEPAVMWGTAIVGFVRQHLRYASGRGLDRMVIGFSPRKASTTICLSDRLDAYADLLGRLGKHTNTSARLCVKRLADVDAAVLKELVTRSVANVRAANG